VGSFAVIVIGASVGGIGALRKIAGGLRREIPAALFVVQHIGRCASELPQLLGQAGPLPAAHAVQGEPIRPGWIYVAPPDHHLVLHVGRIRLARGPRENWARPAIDPLFRSAAKIGVVLTGLLNDGSAGLRAIRAAGRLTVVQEPTDAAAPAMPWSALRHAGADYRVRLAEIPELLMRLADELILETEGAPSDWKRRAMS
jgi:two-component system, chemotaxis family, protein-glutamate methylesterase/glutaminase